MGLCKEGAIVLVVSPTGTASSADLVETPELTGAGG